MWEGAKALYNWGPPPPPSFLAPDDLAELMAGAHAAEPTRGSGPRYDVAIVGYGPVGADARHPARPARLAGRRVREAAHRLSAAARGALRPRGRAASSRPPAIADGFARPAPRPPTSTSGATPPAQTLLRFDSRAAGRSAAGRKRTCSRSPSSSGCSIGARAPAASRSRAAAKSSASTPTADGVDASRWRATVARDEVRARFVVGCDGANSFVRAQLGSAVTDLGFFFDWLIVDVLPHRPTPWSPLNVQICDPARPTTLVSGGPGRRRWEFMRLPDETHRGSQQRGDRLAPARAVGRAARECAARTAHRVSLPGALGGRLARGPRAARRRRGASDAAVRRPGHVLGPARRRQPRLEARPRPARRARRDRCSTPTRAERVPHVRRAIDVSMELGKVICIADPAEAAARDAAMIAAAAAGHQIAPPAGMPIGPGVTRADDAARRAVVRAGTRAPRGRQRASSTTSSVAAGR